MRACFLIVGILGATGATLITGLHGWHLGYSAETSATFAFFFSFVSVAAMAGPMLTSVVLRKVHGAAKAWAILFAFGAAAAFVGNALNSLDAVVTRFDRTKAGRESATEGRKDIRDELERLKRERAAMPAFTPSTPDMVAAAKTAAKSATDAKAAECRERGPQCRRKEDAETAAISAHFKAVADLAQTEKAAKIDKEMATLRKQLGGHSAEATTADPWANAVARFMSIKEGDAATLRWFYLSVVVEMSVALFLFAFELLGQHKPVAVEEKQSDTHKSVEPAPRPAAAIPAPPAPVRAAPARASEDTVGRFLISCLPRAEGSEVSLGEIYVRYKAYCDAEKCAPANIGDFWGRLSTLCNRANIKTERRGDRVFCLNVRLVA